jgi:hypothetical protein
MYQPVGKLTDLAMPIKPEHLDELLTGSSCRARVDFSSS